MWADMIMLTDSLDLGDKVVPVNATRHRRAVHAQKGRASSAPRQDDVPWPLDGALAVYVSAVRPARAGKRGTRSPVHPT